MKNTTIDFIVKSQYNHIIIENLINSNNSPEGDKLLWLK